MGTALFGGAVFIGRVLMVLAWLVFLAGGAVYFFGASEVCGRFSSCSAGQRIGMFVGGFALSGLASLGIFWAAYMLLVTHSILNEGPATGHAGVAPAPSFLDGVRDRYIREEPSRSLALIGAALVVLGSFGPWTDSGASGLDRGWTVPALVAGVLMLVFIAAISTRLIALSDGALGLGTAAAGLVAAAITAFALLGGLSAGLGTGWGIWLAAAGACLWAIPASINAWPRLSPAISGAQAAMAAGQAAAAVPTSAPPVPAAPASSARFCAGCGASLGEGLRFCTNCGRSAAG